ncbi:hypothetical protein ACFLT5_02995 [Chloroflexota bacterium]
MPCDEKWQRRSRTRATGTSRTLLLRPYVRIMGWQCGAGAIDLVGDALGVLVVNVVFLVWAQCLTLLVQRAWSARRGMQATRR